MKTFEIMFTWEGAFQVDAENEEQALEKFNDMSFSEIAEIAHSTFFEEILGVFEKVD